MREIFVFLWREITFIPRLPIAMTPDRIKPFEEALIGKRIGTLSSTLYLLTDGR